MDDYKKIQKENQKLSVEHTEKEENDNNDNKDWYDYDLEDEEQ